MLSPDHPLTCIWVNSPLTSWRTRRLRQKIHPPYQFLAQHVSRLERLRQATDVLRRVSRFVIIARRLEFQMSEIQRLEASAKALGSTNNTNGSGPSEKTRPNAVGGIAQNQDGEKERTIAKAALSIAELGKLLRKTLDEILTAYSCVVGQLERRWRQSRRREWIARRANTFTFNKSSVGAYK